MPPRVSFLLPVYNEQEHLGESLASIAAQEYPAAEIEVLIADGNSNDGTLRIVDDFRRAHPDLAVVVIRNPARNTSVGRNLCLRQATGQLVMNFSGHAVAAPDMLRVLVDKLAALPARVAGVGCAIRASQPATAAGRAIATALGSPLGGGGSMDSSFHAPADREARSLAFCLYRRELLDKIGGFDPDFWCGQDAELNLRLSQDGYRLIFTPDTSVLHYKRTSLRAFVRQMYRYGVARAHMVRKFPASWRLVYLLPGLWVLAVLGAAIGSALNPAVGVASLVAAGLFVVLSVASAVMAGGGMADVVLSPLVYAALYSSYGVGFWRGLIPTTPRQSPAAEPSGSG